MMLPLTWWCTNFWSSHSLGWKRKRTSGWSCILASVNQNALLVLSPPLLVDSSVNQCQCTISDLYSNHTTNMQILWKRVVCQTVVLYFYADLVPMCFSAREAPRRRVSSSVWDALCALLHKQFGIFCKGWRADGERRATGLMWEKNAFSPEGTEAKWLFFLNQW